MYNPPLQEAQELLNSQAKHSSSLSGLWTVGIGGLSVGSQSVMIGTTKVVPLGNK